MTGSGDYISREAFLAEQRHLYCENCARRKGMKNGKMKFVYEIGDAPCRACGIGDVLDDVENFPAADVRPVERAKWEDVHIDHPEIADIEVASMFCPHCNRWHNEVYCYGNPIEFANHCQFCGADMRPKEET